MSTDQKITESAGGVILNQDGLVLVVNQHGLSWSLPKGHIEDGENKKETAKREIYEESGIDQLEFISELGSYQRYKISLDGGDNISEQKTITIFLFKTNQTELKPKDPENPEARWVKIDEVANLLTHRKDKEFFLSIANTVKQTWKQLIQ